MSPNGLIDFKMKVKITLFSLLLSFLISACAQSSHADGNDSVTDFPFYYSRTITEDSLEKRKIYVTFIFENGKKQRAVTYRQEIMKNRIKWDESCQMSVANENDKVEKITANLSPFEKVEWQYSLSAKPKESIIQIEKAALLIMNEQFEVEKITFDAIEYPLKK